ncbi:chitinase-3-like protein 1 [Scyliorhinus torazame]|uniref:chitinase-3-like protein 1 n=1 Tax=Scyliorhinus torazame TaxID=75743 RepID=UPI003B5A58A6
MNTKHSRFEQYLPHSTAVQRLRLDPLFSLVLGLSKAPDRNPVTEQIPSSRMGKALLLTVSLLLLQHVSMVSPETLMCYYLPVDQGADGRGRIDPGDIDPCLCSHLVYFDKYMTKYVVDWKDNLSYKKFNDLKNKNKNLKTLFSYEGTRYGLARFLRGASLQPPPKYMYSIIAFLRKNNFDGLDLNWNYPAYFPIDAKDTLLFTYLVKGLREAFNAEAETYGKDRLLLTAKLGAYNLDVGRTYNVASISKDLDFISVITYNLAGDWSSKTEHHSALHRGSAHHDNGIRNVEAYMKKWTDQGAPAEKLLVGMPTFAITFTLKTSQEGLGAPISGPGKAGSSSRSPGFLTFREVCPLWKGANIYSNDDQVAVFAVKDNQWIGYDDWNSFRKKANWLQEKKFGGAMVSALNDDDFSGTECKQGNYPLIRILKNILHVNAECEQSG